MRIYTEAHSVYATINLPVDLGFTVSNIQLFTDKLFNSDNLIEFLLVTSQSGTYKMTLLNQNGDVLQQFGDKNEALNGGGFWSLDRTLMKWENSAEVKSITNKEKWILKF